VASFRDRWRYEHGDPSIKLFDYAVKAGWIEQREGAVVLELGCCETDFSKWWKSADIGGYLVGIDINVPQGGHYDYFEQSDASTMWNQPNWFDAVILLGSLEHFGLGFYGDPISEDADCRTMQNVARWLKPGGWCFVDVPWTPESFYITDNRHFRVYDDAALRSRITGGLTVEREAWAVGHPDPPPALVDERPDEPMSPFWYNVRVLRKAA
jgi:SAM-dependent methyltransferase